MDALLDIRGLKVEIEGREIIHGLDLSLPRGETHAIMGPNGSGKSTLSYTLLGHPRYTVSGGQIYFEGQSLAGLTVDQRARLGIFLSMQYPTAIPGVTVTNFLRTALKNLRGADVPVKDFRRELKEAMGALQMDPNFAARYVNDGFSGGEKKRHEVLQMTLMQPKLCILDEIDSGLDIDALRILAAGVERLRSPERSMLLITHYQRLLNYLSVDRIHVFMAGRIVMSGGRELAEKLEAHGYEWAAREAGLSPGAL
ncbi:MAG: Fe-S cluster assembly ATPase SufC [Leptospirales bacterium]|nr:Fe-S cluster assembly ATPase SufC [Leptospirales bacterium]